MKRQKKKTAKAVDFNFIGWRNELAEAIADALKQYSGKFESHRVHGLAIDCHPWHKTLELCLCTDEDEAFIKKHGKWWLADWKHFQFTRAARGHSWPAVKSLAKQMYVYHEKGDGEPEERVWDIICACAGALLSRPVVKALQEYKLAKDFDVFVTDPDDEDAGNVCEVMRKYLKKQKSKKRKG
jgi:hypothetical protein